MPDPKGPTIDFNAPDVKKAYKDYGQAQRDALEKIYKEYPDAPQSDLRQAVFSTAPRMHHSSAEIQDRFRKLMEPAEKKLRKVVPKHDYSAALDTVLATRASLTPSPAEAALADVLKVRNAVKANKSYGSPELDALAEVVNATKTVLRSGTDVKAAKDSGTKGQDKKRKSDLIALVTAANALEEMLVGTEGFPEVKGAIDAVKSLTELSTRLDEATIRLSAAPAKSEEAIMAQATVDDLRANIDTMLPPLMATVETMETLVAAAAAMETQFAEMEAQCKALATRLEGDKKRLSNAAKAVQNAAKLG